MSPLEPSDVIFGELTDAERAEAEERMRTDPEFREQVERLRPTVARLEELPDEAWQDLDPPPPPSATDLEGAPQQARKRRRRLVLRPAFAVGVAAVLIAVGIGAGTLLDGSGDESPGDGPTIALAPVDEGRPGESGEVELDDGRRNVVISVDGLPASDEDEFYEAWLLSETDEVVSLGGFRVGDDGTGELEAELPDDPSTYRFFDVSVEKADGDASHSGRSVLRAGTSAS